MMIMLEIELRGCPIVETFNSMVKNQISYNSKRKVTFSLSEAYIKFILVAKYCTQPLWIIYLLEDYQLYGNNSFITGVVCLKIPF